MKATTVLLAPMVLTGCSPALVPAPSPPPASAPAPAAASVPASRVELLAAIQAQDAPRVETLLRAAPALVDSTTDKGTPVVLSALFLMKDKEGFVRPQDNAVLTAVLAHHPTLDGGGVAAFGDAHAVQAALEGAAGYVGSRPRLGWTPLHFAAFTGNTAAARALLDAGADANAVADNQFRNTPLQVAMLTLQVDVARLLLARGADVRHRQESGYTALHEAAQAGSRELVELLLVAGADPAARADDGRTPADMAHGREDILARLDRARPR